MNNFLDFIKKDIDAKRTLISTMPTKTKTNQKKFNENIETILKKYEEYKTNTRNYLLAKTRSFELKEEQKDINKLTDKLVALEYAKFLLNPSNTYYEKMGFDVLMYQINNYYTFNFSSLNEIINGFLDKFEAAGVSLNANDFNYTCYVHEYMQAFLEVRKNPKIGYSKVSQIFEQIYWVNPEIIEHIELNFRKIIKKNDKKFGNYIDELKKDVMHKNGISNYAECLSKLEGAYIELVLADKEEAKELIEMAKKGEFDIDQYMPDHKVRKTAYESLISEGIDTNNKEAMAKVCATLEKLKASIEEYQNYVEFTPMFNDFKAEFKGLIPTDTAKKVEYKGLKEVEEKINAKESELEKLNKKIYTERNGFFGTISENELKRLKTESIYKAKELYELYKEYDKEYFKDKIITLLDNTLCISDLLNLYYSFDYYKKMTLRKVFNLETYDEIIEYSNKFDLFAMNPTNIISEGIPIFTESNIPRIIANKYRLNNIKLEEDDLIPENLQIVMNKILLILRVNTIDNSKTTLEKIWFMVNVNKILSKEEPKE